MPTMVSPVSKSKAMMALLQRYHGVQNNAEKASTVEMMNGVFPDIRFLHDSDSGLVAYFLRERVRGLPHSVEYAANLILSFLPGGEVDIQKDRTGRGLAALGVSPRDLFVELGGLIPRKSRWEKIGSDNDWLDL